MENEKSILLLDKTTDRHVHVPYTLLHKKTQTPTHKIYFSFFFKHLGNLWLKIGLTLFWLTYIQTKTKRDKATDNRYVC